VTGDLATLADKGILLNLNERTNLGFVANFTAIKVDETR
jgi:hypothetical protein